MNGIYLLGLLVLAAIGILIVRRRQREALPLTEQAIHCPQYGDLASLTVRTDATACPSRRYRDVSTCSLMPPISCVPPTRTGFFSDLSPAEPYVREVSTIPYRSDEVRCPKACLPVLNADASGPLAAEPIRCTSGMSDGFELARQTQPPAIMRALWYHSV